MDVRQEYTPDEKPVHYNTVHMHTFSPEGNLVYPINLLACTSEDSRELKGNPHREHVKH